MLRSDLPEMESELSCDSTLLVNSMASCSGLASSSLNFTSISWYASCTHETRHDRVETKDEWHRV
jgi:hypothetical protein